MSDHVISNNLVVLGMSTFTGGQTFDGQMIVDLDNTEALLVRKDGDGGDVFVVDTVNSLVIVDAALAFGPLGVDGPATTGSIRLKNLDTIVIRNAQDDDDHFILESLVSDEYNMFDPLIGRVDFLDLHTRFFKRITVHQDGNATNALQVGGTGIFIVDTTNRLIRLAQDDAVLTWGTASDAQMHRGDGADIIEQRRGVNPQEWRLYDRFVSHADYDRLAIYIGGGPPLKTIEFVAESTVGNQGISIDIEAKIGSGDGRVRLINGGTNFSVASSSATLTTTGGALILTTGGVTALTMNGVINSIGGGVGSPVAAIVITGVPEGGGGFADSHSINQIGFGELSNRAEWKFFVDVIDSSANSIWTLQDSKNGGGFVTNFSITDDGGFNFPLPLPSHAIGLAIDTQNQLTLGGDYFALAGADLIGTRFKIQDRITNATGNITGFFAMNIDANLRTQGVTESVANIATVSINEPQITDLLTGGGLITHAQTLLITGAPTEGVSNFAFRILGGDIEIDNSSAFLFDDGGGGSLSALSVAPTNRLEIGLSGTPWSRLNVHAVTQILSDTQTAFLVTDADSTVELFKVTQTQTRVIGTFVVQAKVVDHEAQTRIQSTFADVATSAGSSVTAAGVIPAGSFVIAITVLVTSTVGGPASFDVGDGIDVDRWGASISGGSFTTTDITDFTSGAVTTFQVASDVVLTSTGVDFTSGNVRITVHYMTVATSTES
jgi:hypothetical protein